MAGSTNLSTHKRAIMEFFDAEDKAGRSPVSARTVATKWAWTGGYCAKKLRELTNEGVVDRWARGPEGYSYALNRKGHAALQCLRELDKQKAKMTPEEQESIASPVVVAALAGAALGGLGGAVVGALIGAALNTDPNQITGSWLDPPSTTEQEPPAEEEDLKQA